MNKNEFFRQGTLRICSSLAIDESLFSVLQFLRQIMPVDRIYLELYDEALQAMRVIAEATANGGRQIDWVTPISNEALQQFKQVTKSISSDVYLTSIPSTEDLTQEMLTSLRIQATSLMVLKLDANTKILGTAVFISEGKALFEKEHSKLISLLKESFVIAMSNALKHREVVKLKDMLADDNRYLHTELRHLVGEEIIGANFGLREVMEKVSHVAGLDSPVLLLGETGVGKDVIANAIHHSSHRKDGPFVKVNCGAIPEALVDSELFGHEKGAFTGALSQKRGRFERADRGTIFLDEIGELPLQAQVRLLRVLQDKEIERVGGSKSIHLDIRIMAATNRNLEEMVSADRFREDLWFRLNVFPIWIPPLRQRKSDIPALVQYFISKKTKELKLPGAPQLAPHTMRTLMEYDWPGNVRELENIVERTLILDPKGPLTFERLTTASTPQKPPATNLTEEIEKFDVVVSKYFRRVLAVTNGKINGPEGAAELVGVHPNTLRNRLKKLGINFGRQN